MARFRCRAPYLTSVPSSSRYSWPFGHGENERPFEGRLENSLLHLAQFQIEDAAQFRLTERLEHHDLIDAVHELRRELPARGFDSALRHLLAQFRLDFGRLLCSARQAAGSQAWARSGCSSRSRRDCWS